MQHMPAQMGVVKSVVVGEPWYRNIADRYAQPADGIHDPHEMDIDLFGKHRTKPFALLDVGRQLVAIVAVGFLDALLCRLVKQADVPDHSRQAACAVGASTETEQEYSIACRMVFA